MNNRDTFKVFSWVFRFLISGRFELLLYFKPISEQLVHLPPLEHFDMPPYCYCRTMQVIIAKTIHHSKASIISGHAR